MTVPGVLMITAAGRGFLKTGLFGLHQLVEVVELTGAYSALRSGHRQPSRQKTCTRRIWGCGPSARSRRSRYIGWCSCETDTRPGLRRSQNADSLCTLVSCYSSFKLRPHSGQILASTHSSTYCFSRMICLAFSSISWLMFIAPPHQNFQIYHNKIFPLH